MFCIGYALTINITREYRCIVNRVFQWLGIVANPAISLSEEFAYIDNMFCRLTVLELGASKQNADNVIIPPFLHKNAGVAPSKKSIDENLSVYWPIILHNAFKYGVCEINDKQFSLLKAFESTLRNLDNPWVAFLYNCGKERISFKIAISRQDDWTKNALSIARQHYDDNVEIHIQEITKSFSFEYLQLKYIELQQS